MSTLSKVKNMAVRMVAPANSAILERVVDAGIRLFPGSRRALIAKAVILKTRGQSELAAQAYLDAGTRTDTPSKYYLIAISMLIGSKSFKSAGRILAEMARLPKNGQWMEDLAAAVTKMVGARQIERVTAISNSLAGNPKHRDVAGLILLFAGRINEAQRVLAEVSWSNHKLRDVFAFRILGMIEQARRDSVTSNGAFVEDLLVMVPSSLEDYFLAKPDENISALSLLQHKGAGAPFRRRLGSQVYILAEPKTDLERVVEQLDADGRQVVLYANGDEQAAFAREHGWETRSLREIVPDQSPVTDALYAHAERLARFVVCQILQDLDRERESRFREYLSEHQSTFEMLLEDRIARELVLLEGSLSALKECPADADFLLVVGNALKFPNMLPWFLPQLDRDRIFLLAPELINREKSKFVNGIKEAVEGKRPTSLTPKWLSGEAATKNLDGAADSFNKWWASFDDRISEIGTRDCGAVEEGATMFLANLLDRNYGDGNFELAIKLRSQRPLLLLSTTEHRTARWDQDDAAGALASEPYQSLPVLCRDEIDRARGYAAGQAFAQAILASKTIQGLTYQGRPVWRLMITPILNWARLDVAMGMVEHSYLETALRSPNIGNLVVTPGRNRPARMAATIARRNHVHSVDVQMVNTPAYRKYKPPLADTVTAIDDIAGDLLVDYFGVEPRKIRLVGSPKLDMFRAAVEQIDKQAVLAEAGLTAGGGPVICFASQLQPVALCLDIIEVLTDYVSSNPDARLVIKMHPREDEARQMTFASFIARRSLEGRVCLLSDFDMQKVYAISDVLVTMYSNAAREALVLGRRVIIANFTDKPWPMRFYLPGLASGAYSPEQLYAELDRACDISSSQGDTMPQGEYIERNSHLFASRAVDLISQLVAEREPLSASEVG